jgi:Activator of Hsp90 ATPase homolog 1-like protein
MSRSDESFTLEWTTDRDPVAVTDALADVHGWWGADITGTAARVGDVFEFEVPGVHWTRIRVEELEPGARVVWRVLDNRMTFVADQSEWIGTRVRFDVTATDRGSRLHFTHEGLTPAWECYSACYDGWTFYAGRSLQELVATGTGHPHGHAAEPTLRAAAAPSA